MKKAVVLYGSSTGNTKSIAEKIGSLLSCSVYDVANNPINEVEHADLLVLGTSTWGFGDLQEDWDSFLKSLTKIDLKGKTIALFGLGDSSTYSDTFVDGMGIIYKALINQGCNFIGKVDATRYSYDSSEAEVNGEFVGLALDEDSESEKTESRLQEWLGIIKKDLI